MGRPRSIGPILACGHVLSITTNLKAALSALRKMDKERVLWAHALCISQSGMQERNEQVLGMREIYQHAKRTIAWLGSSGHGSLRALDVLQRLGAAKAHIELLKISFPMLWWSRPLYDPTFGIGAEMDELIF